MTEDEFKTRMLLLGLEVTASQSEPPGVTYPYYGAQVIRAGKMRRMVASTMSYTDPSGNAAQARAELDWQGLYDKVCRNLRRDP